jgi:protein-tyrosine phosphatase
MVCTANICRSPMAEAFLARRLAGLGSAASVRSAGLLGDGAPPHPEVITVMTGYGLDVAGHRSRRVTPDDLERADLTIAMAREHLRHAVVAVPAVWSRAFTLRELVRRGGTIGQRTSRESLPEWLDRIHEGRERAALLGDSPDDDVADPTGGPPHGYTETAATLSQLVNQLFELCWEEVELGG